MACTIRHVLAFPGPFVDATCEQCICLWLKRSTLCRFMLSAVDCGVPLIANAAPINTSKTTYGAAYTVRCQTGYKTDSADGLVTCGKSGKWSAFSCNGKNATRIRVNTFHSLMLAGVHCPAFSISKCRATRQDQEKQVTGTSSCLLSNDLKLENLYRYLSNCLAPDFFPY